MNQCTMVTGDMLINPVDISAGSEIDFNGAKQLADQAARNHLQDPMMLAWFVRETGAFSPPVECCGEDKPSWLIYAENRGARLTVDINGGAYIFVYGNGLAGS